MHIYPFKLAALNNFWSYYLTVLVADSAMSWIGSGSYSGQWSQNPQEAIGDSTIFIGLCTMWKHCPVSTDKHTCMCACTCTNHTYCVHIQAHHKTESESKECNLLPAEKPKQFSVHVTGQIVAKAPKAPPTSVSSQLCYPRMGSVDKAPSGHLLTRTRSLWVLNGKDLLK